MKSVDSSELTVPQIDILEEASYQTKERAAPLVLSIPFSRELSHSGMGVPSNTWPKAYLFHLSFTFSETRRHRGRTRVQLQPIPDDATSLAAD